MTINDYTYNAIEIAEGFIECEDKEKIIEVWQHLIDTGVAYKLQGRFGRTANQLIEEGICQMKGEINEQI